MTDLGDTHFADDTYLAMLIQHEEALSELYKVFQERVSEHWDFWGKLVTEEIGHANILRHVQEKLKTGEVQMAHRNIAMKDIKLSQDFIARETHEARNSKLSAEDAFVMALRAETTIVERQFLRSFKTDSPEVAEVFRKLKEQSQEHYARIEKMAKNPPRRPRWMKTIFGTIRRKPLSD